MNLQRPILILMCGLFSIGLGCGLVVLGGQVAGLTPLAVAMILLGSFLVVVWLRSGRAAPSVSAAETKDTEPTEDDARSRPPAIPGVWYPYVLLGIGAALMIWLLVWTKIIR